MEEKKQEESIVENNEKTESNTKIVSLKSSRVIETEKDIGIGAGNIITLARGTPLDNYTFDKKIGEGCKATVFRVKHKDLEVYRAMKKVFISSRKRFKRRKRDSQ